MLQVEVNWKGRLWQFDTVEICSMLLIQIKENAERSLGTIVTDAVITIPVCFNYKQRQAIKQAGMIAGLNFIQIISAPAASAFFYSIERFSKSTHESDDHNMVIFDLGAGTLDVAVVTNKGDTCKVRAIAGDIHLGGSDFDNNLVDYFVTSLKERGWADIRSIPMAISKLRTVCEKAKISLSYGINTVPMKITPLYSAVDFESSITEAKFNEINDDLFLKCIMIMETCLIDSGISIDAIHEVILVGSSARIPIVKTYIQCCFENKVLSINQHLEVATVYGAAFQAYFLSRRENKSRRYLSLLDVAPFSLGLRSLQGKMDIFIPKNTNIPIKIEKTINSNIRPYLVEVYEGEGTLVRENKFLGKLELFGSQISSNWHNTRINVSFEIHETGTLTVTAEEIPHGKRKNITLFNNKIEDSQDRVREALLNKEIGKGVNKTSTTKSLTKSDTSCNWDKIRDTKSLNKLMSMDNMDKDKSSKYIGQHIRQYREPEEYAIGIDFGTTYSCVAVWQQNCAKIIENEYGSRLTCSVVAFTDTGRLIGDTVHKKQVMINPTNTISNIKRLIGRCYSDQTVQNDSIFRPFKILCNDKNRTMVSVQYKNKKKLFAPEEIAAIILLKMREIAEAHLNSRVKNAVICVPASFSDSQRKAIKDAGVIAGLNVMQLLNEPTAAAIAYCLQTNSGGSSNCCKQKILLIFDLGGGNLDVSIVAIKEGRIRVQAVASDTNLGGENFDNNIVSHFVEKFMKEKRRNISNKPRSLRKLQAACEKAKRLLSANAQTMVEIDALDDGIDFRSTLTRKTFEDINKDLFKRCVGCIERCLEDADIDRSCIDEVVLIGGSTRIPKMQQVLQEFFNGKELCMSLNADEAVVCGAAVQAAILSGNEDREKFNILQLQDVTSLSLGIGNEDGATMNLLIPKHTPIPITKELIFTNCTDGLSNFSIQVQECELASTMVFTLSGITPKPRVTLKVNVSFEVDHSGILNLKAKDMNVKKKNEIEINKDNRGLTTEEIQKMVEAAAYYKVEDEEDMKKAATLHSLENFAYEMKTIAKEAGVAFASKKSVEEAANYAIEWLETNYHASADEINARRKKLETIKNQIVYLGTDANL